jgi:hypothetical protein
MGRRQHLSCESLQAVAKKLDMDLSNMVRILRFNIDEAYDEIRKPE